MSEVALRIAGKTYMIACGEGEEARLVKLGEMVDAKLQGMGGRLAGQEAQNILFAALLLADELDETRAKGTPSAQSDMGKRLDAVADALEKCAATLESKVTRA